MNQNLEKICSSMNDRVNELLKQWNLPGVSVALVENGETVLCGGYGSRDIKENLEMTDKTHLPIGSATKSFTSLALGMLVDEGKLSWDEPVISYIPWLKLSDSVVEKRVTARDLMCHRSGVAKYDAPAVFCTKDSRKEMVEDLKYLQLGADFRTTLQYSNQMVMLAGYLVEVLSGKSWEEFVQERILDELGMNDTSFYAEKIEEFDNYSRGYVFTGTDYMQTEYLPLRGVGPAGSIVSTAEDMANYISFQLGDGTWKGKRLVSNENLQMMHTPQVIGTPYFWRFDEVTETNYGLGWFTDLYRGTRMVSHGGNTLGFSSLVTLLPEKNFGIALLSNGNSNFMIYPLTYMILDEVLGVEDGKWNERFQTTLGAIFAGMAEGQKQLAEARIPDTTVSHPIQEYAGEYFHPGFGTLILQEQDGQLSGTLNGFAAMLTHYHYDVFTLMLPLMGLALQAQFTSGFDGKISGIAIQMEPTPGIEPVHFEKR